VQAKVQEQRKAGDIVKTTAMDRSIAVKPMEARAKNIGMEVVIHIGL
jgi:hypothetical protein